MLPTNTVENYILATYFCLEQDLRNWITLKQDVKNEWKIFFFATFSIKQCSLWNYRFQIQLCESEQYHVFITSFQNYIESFLNLTTGKSWKGLLDKENAGYLTLKPVLCGYSTAEKDSTLQQKPLSILSAHMVWRKEAGSGISGVGFHCYWFPAKYWTILYSLK